MAGCCLIAVSCAAHFIDALNGLHIGVLRRVLGVPNLGEATYRDLVFWQLRAVLPLTASSSEDALCISRDSQAYFISADPFRAFWLARA